MGSWTKATSFRTIVFFFFFSSEIRLTNPLFWFWLVFLSTYLWLLLLSSVLYLPQLFPFSTTPQLLNRPSCMAPSSRLFPRVSLRAAPRLGFLEGVTGLLMLEPSIIFPSSSGKKISRTDVSDLRLPWFSWEFVVLFLCPWIVYFVWFHFCEGVIVRKKSPKVVFCLWVASGCWEKMSWKTKSWSLFFFVS